MKIIQKDQIVILFSLDEYIKIIKRTDRKKQIEDSMEILEKCQDESVNLDKETLNIYLTSLKFYAYHSSQFWKEECLETYKELKQNYANNIARGGSSPRTRRKQCARKRRKDIGTPRLANSVGKKPKNIRRKRY